MSEAEAHKEKGNSFFREKKYTLALECYLLAAQLDPKNAVYSSNLGATYLVLGDEKVAAHYCTKAVDLDPTLHKAHFRLGMIEERKKNFTFAADHYKNALKHDPNNTDYQKKLVHVSTMLSQERFALLLKEQKQREEERKTREELSKIRIDNRLTLMLNLYLRTRHHLIEGFGKRRYMTIPKAEPLKFQKDYNWVLLNHDFTCKLFLNRHYYASPNDIYWSRFAVTHSTVEEDRITIFQPEGPFIEVRIIGKLIAPKEFIIIDDIDVTPPLQYVSGTHFIENKSLDKLLLNALKTNQETDVDFF